MLHFLKLLLYKKIFNAEISLLTGLVLVIYWHVVLIGIDVDILNEVRCFIACLQPADRRSEWGLDAKMRKCDVPYNF